MNLFGASKSIIELRNFISRSGYYTDLSVVEVFFITYTHFVNIVAGNTIYSDELVQKLMEFEKNYEMACMAFFWFQTESENT